MQGRFEIQNHQEMNSNIPPNTCNLFSKQQTTGGLQQTDSHTVLIGTGSDFGVDLYHQANNYRVQFKKKALIQDIIGELALSELMQFNVMNSQDPRFAQIMDKYSLVQTGNQQSIDQVEYMIYEHHQLPKTGYLQNFTQNEVKEALQKALDDMVNGAFRLKLLQSYQHSHIAFNCLQTGPKMNIFRISALLTRKSLSVETIVQCCTGMRSTNGFVIVGKVLNNQVKPCLLIANRGQNNQITVGPNRIGFSIEDGEFRVMIPDEYQGQFTSQVIQSSIFEIYVTQANDQSFLYGQGSDLQSNFATTAELGVSDLIPDSSSPYYAQRIFQRNDSLLTVFNSRDLCGIKSLTFEQQHQQQNFQNVAFRTTKTQTLREQNSAGLKTQGTIGMNINFNKSQTQNLMKIGGNKTNFSLSQQNENQNPNLQLQSRPPLTFMNQQQQQPTLQLNLKPPMNQPNILPFKFNLNPPSNQIQSQQSVLPSQTSLQRAFTIQPQQPQQQQPQIQFNFNTQQSQIQPGRSLINTFQQPPKISFNHSKTMQQQPSLMTNASTNASNVQMEKPPLVFNELSLIDQQTLQGYLRELQEELTPEQLQRVTTLMLTDPVKFYQYFQIAHEQLMLQKKDNTKVKKNEDEKKEEGKKDEEKKQISEYDDLTVFFLTLPPALIESKQDKYKDYMQQLAQNKLTTRQILLKLLLRTQFPTNDSFQLMYASVKETGDMILELRTEEFACHKIVMTATSEYFKKALKENEMINKYQYQVRGPYKQRLIVPEWIDTRALKHYLAYMYTGKIGQMEVVDTINLLKTANYFYHQCLQEQLIAEHIIPSLNPQSAVLYLKECYQELEDPPHAASISPNAPVHRKSCTFAWQFLYSYAQYYLQKHLSTLLRSSPKLAYDLPSVLLRRIIDKSLLYVVDAQGRDLDSILQFTAESWTVDRSVTTLFKKSQQTMDSCSAFHQQVIPQMGEFIRQIDPKIDYQCKLIKDTSQEITLAPNSSPNQSQQEANSMNDNTFYQGSNGGTSTKGLLDSGEEIELSQWKPSSNIVKSVPNTSEIFDREPQYQTTIQLDDVSLKSSFDKNKGLSIFSKAFDFGRRSWMLKIDLDTDGHISLYLVERGPPLGLEGHAQLQLGVTVPIKFSSVLTQFEIVDPAFGDHKTYVFYSFAHDQNQVIGHEKLMNLSQMQNKSQLKVKVHMKEFLMHSALTWHLSQNFQDYLAKDLKQMEIYKNNNCSPYSYTNSNGLTSFRDFDLLNLRFYTVYQLFSSQHLRVDSENQLLSFLFHYSNYQQLRQPSKATFSYIMDVLSSQQALRMYHVSTSKILSALRDNEHMRTSKIFMSRVQLEFQARATLPHSQLVSLNLSSDSLQQQKIQEQAPRKYYDASRVDGRKKYEATTTSTNSMTLKQGSIFIDELIEWFKKSKHQKRIKEEAGYGNQGYQASSSLGGVQAKQEIMKLQALYYEERRKCQDLMAQLSRAERRNQELEKLIGQGDQWKYGVHRRSNSQNDLKHQQYQRYYSPPNQRNNYVNYNNEIVNAARQQPQRAANMGNSSFDQSAFYSLKNSQELFNDTFKNYQMGGSTTKAEKKVITNQYQDMTRLLNRIDRNNSPNNRGRPTYQGGNNDVPYYRQGKQQQNNDECIIF